VLYQASTIGALMDGVYDGHVSFSEVKQHGDFGLGTFDALNGEMIAIDGAFYQIKTDGLARPVPDDMSTPFVVVTFFHPDITLTVNTPLSCDQLKTLLNTALPGPNGLYAVRVDGHFDHVTARSVPAQLKPYPGLSEAAKSQVIFKYQHRDGSIVAFLLPQYLKDINVAGLHAHFITSDKTAGGHVLDCKIASGTITVSVMNRFLMELPDFEYFYKFSMHPDMDKAIKKIEH
jgi:acetolactate decarboxylase